MVEYQVIWGDFQGVPTPGKQEIGDPVIDRPGNLE
jgi:hypothetical protein